ncbi:NADPH:quinone reductase [Altererythrobacter sp. Z27]|uniref:NADPH:quinone reductase n=1 Tax=Altererythrobacter sp. Z27 TaxID=3461147 RepID=UPI0040440A28
MLTIGELPVPEVAPGEVLVSIKASGINPSDTKGRGGNRGNLAMPFPRIVAHQDGAGVIAAVGQGVPESRIGERVWLYEAQLGRAHGTAAQFIALPSAQAVTMPDSLSFAEGACLGVPALTAHRCVFADGPVTGKTVLVTGGAGAVGFYAVQFAKRDGARVIATVSTEEQAAAARRAGADLVINRRVEDIVASAADFTGAEDERSVDRIIEVAFGANLATSMRMLKPNGVIASYASDLEPEPVLPFWPLVVLDATVRFVLVYVMSAEAHQEAIAYVSKAASEGWLLHNIGHVLPLEAVAEAHELVETGRGGGKVIIELD